MDSAWRRARKISGLAKFERLSRRKVRDGRYWMFAWRAIGTPEYFAHVDLWLDTRVIARELREKGLAA